MDYNDEYVGLTKDQYAARIALLKEQARLIRKEMSTMEKVKYYLRKALTWLK